MKKNSRFTAFVLAFCMCLGTVGYAAEAETKPETERDTVRVEFGKTNINDGAVLVDGIPYLEERDGRIGRRTDKAGSIYYGGIAVDDSFIYDCPNYTPLEVTIEYFDEGNGIFSLQYDSYNESPRLYAKGWKTAGLVYLKNTKEWKTHTYYIEDARMRNASGRGNGDLRIGIWDGYIQHTQCSPTDVIFGSVTVKKVDYKTPVLFDGVTCEERENFACNFTPDQKVEMNAGFTNKTFKDVILDIKTTVYDENGKTASETKAQLELASRGAGSVKVTADNPKKYGVYDFDIEVTASYKDGSKTYEPVVFERTFAITKKITQGEGNPVSGVCTHIIYNQKGDADKWGLLARQAGISIVREEIRWDALEKVKGQLKMPEEFMEDLRQYKENGIDVLLVCSFGPAWMNYGSPRNDEEVEQWKKYCEFLARETKDYVKYYEVWNEYDLDHFNKNNQPPEMYAKLLKAAYTAIKKENPEATVVGIATSRFYLDWTETVFKQGGYDYLDAVSVHPYDWSGSFREQVLVQNTEDLKALMRKYGEEKPVWFTEVGYSTWEGGYTYEQQCGELLTLHCFIRGYDLCEKITQFAMFDGNDNQGQYENGWGLVRDNSSELHTPYSSKPSFLAMANMNDFIGKNAEFKGKLVDNDNRVYAFNFENSKMGKNVMILMTGEGYSAKSFSLGCKSVDMYDMYGNYINTLTSDNGIYSLTVSDIPYYIIGNFEKFEWVDEIGAIEAESFLEICTPDDVATFGLVSHTNEKLNIEVECQKGVTIYENNGFKNGKAEVKLKTPVDAQGDINARITVKSQNGKVLYIGTHILRVRDFVEAEIMGERSVEGDSTHWRARVKIKNNGNVATRSGTVRVVGPEDFAKKIAPRRLVDIKPGETAELVFNLPVGIIKNTVPLELEIELNNGKIAKIGKTIDFTSCMYTKKVPEIDGVVSPGEWTGSWVGAAEEKDMGTFKDKLYWSGPEDLSLAANTMWDEENFYCLGVVTDDIYSTNYTPTGITNLWRGDSIQIGLHDIEHVNIIDHGNFTEFGMAILPGEGPRIFRSRQLYTNVKPLENAKVGIKVYDGYVVYECSIPWDEIYYEGYEIVPGGFYRFSMAANENDGTERKGYAQYTAGIVSSKDVTLFAKMDFVK